MAIPPVTPLPTPPSRSRPDTFATEADAFLGALDTFGTELDNLGDAVEAAEIATAASETAAAASEAAAATSEANAATSETNASGSETNAAASAAAAAASFDSFDDRYLGPKASDPTTDNDGDPLSGGMIYYNTGSGGLKLYNGSAWTAAVLDANGALLAANNLSDLTDTDAAIANLGITVDPTLGTLTKSFASGETASVSLSSSVSPTAVVAVTKEVGQTGASSKGSWDVASDASNYELYNEAPATSLGFEGWDISTASFVQSFSVSAQEITPYGVFFKPDGLKMYVVGSTGDAVYEYNLSTAWDVSTASYSQNFSVAAQEDTPHSIHFKPDGTKMYIIGFTGDDVNEYSLSTAWDISTASYTQSFSVAAQDAAPNGVFFKPDGLKMYITGLVGLDINEYTLSVAWDVSTATYSQNFSVSAQITEPLSAFFRSDGLKMYVIDNGLVEDVNEYDLSTAWDISTASYVQNFSIAGQETDARGLFFKPDGTKMYVVGGSGDDVNEYDIPLKATLGTGSFSSSDVGKRIFVDDGGEAILTATDGSYSLVSAFGASSYTSGNWSLSGLDADATNGITLSELNTTWDLSQASYLQNFDNVLQPIPSGFFFKPDGTRLYIIGNSGDDIDQYDLTTAWDISTASANGRFVVAQDTVPRDLFFKPDGLKMYVIGDTTNSVFEYDLSTAWDVTSASYLQNTGVGESSPEGLFFKPDGTKMYTIGGTGDVDEYNLSTAWDVTTESLLQAFTIGDTPTGIFFRQDGLKAYITQQSGGNDRVSEYNLTTAWDSSTLVFSQSFDVSSQDTAVEGVFFHPLGNKMYIVGDSTNDVFEYDVGILVQPTGQYLPALTSSAGQIDSTYWTDINSMTADDADNDGEVYYAVSTDDRTTWSIAKASDGVRNIVRNNGGTWEYNSNATYGSETWASATTNNEFAAIAQAMTVAANQMNKAQIDAVTDGSHFTLGDTLDLAIVPYLASTGTAPTSDGLSINYDAAALNKGAILGTDYDYDVPAGDVVRITSLATQNLKVRIV